MARAAVATVGESVMGVARLSIDNMLVQENRSTKGAMLLRRARADGDRRGAPMPEWRRRRPAWESDTLMTVVEAARALGIQPEKMRRLLRAGVVFGINFGGAIGWRVFRASLEELGWDNVAVALGVRPEISR